MTPTPELVVLAGLFALAATLYSMAGFGGGSAYIAMLALAGVPISHVAVVALACNVIVVANGSWQFGRRGHLRPGLLLPFVITSVPAAFVAGRLVLEEPTVRLITGLALFAAGILLLVVTRPPTDDGGASIEGSRIWAPALLIGALLGGLAGVVGIGGGVFLAPALYFLRWATAKQIAALSSAFILLNSLAGLLGKAAHVAEPSVLITYAPLLLAVFVGGQVGSRLGAGRLSPTALRRVTGAIVLVAAVNLLVQTMA